MNNLLFAVEDGEHLVVLADRKLLELPLDALPLLQKEGLTSVSRDFSLQFFYGRLNIEETQKGIKYTSSIDFTVATTGLKFYIFKSLCHFQDCSAFSFTQLPNSTNQLLCPLLKKERLYHMFAGSPA